MPLNAKGKEILARMKDQYGDDEGERVFYASVNKGTITDVEEAGDSIAKSTPLFLLRLDAIVGRFAPAGGT